MQEELLQGQPSALQAIGEAREKAEATAAKTRSIIDQLEQYISMYKDSYPDSQSHVHVDAAGGSSASDVSHLAQPSAAVDAGTLAGSTEHRGPTTAPPDDGRSGLTHSAGGHTSGDAPPSKEDVTGNKCDPPLHGDPAEVHLVRSLDGKRLADSSIDFPLPFYNGVERDAGSNASGHSGSSREASMTRQRLP